MCRPPYLKACRADLALTLFFFQRSDLNPQPPTPSRLWCLGRGTTQQTPPHSYAMDSHSPNGSPASKRRKLNRDQPTDDVTSAHETENIGSKTLNRWISPPASRRRRSATPEVSTPRVQAQHEQWINTEQTLVTTATPGLVQGEDRDDEKRCVEFIASPIQLTSIKDLAREQNADAVGLGDILGDPMIKECWNFNYLFDVEFVVNKLDADVRNLVMMKIIHGFWKREDERRIELLEMAERYPNVELISAYIPDPFGTHHSKMLILLRHDDTAQVVIHTANMIIRDWQNMTQSVWRSPLLPLQSPGTGPTGSQNKSQPFPIGSGERFKVDLFNYLNAYEKKCRRLTDQLVAYDFSSIRAAFIGSAPSRQKPSEATPWKQTSWGWLGAREILCTVPIVPVDDSKAALETCSAPNVVMQTSSIATLGQLPTWLTHLQSILGHCSTPSPATGEMAPASGFFAKRTPSISKAKMEPPTFNIIFPTADEIRRSLDGYSCGSSIHTKLQSWQQQKQLEYLRPMLCHWQSSRSRDGHGREAHRGRAAPHIKTYIRFSTAEHETMDWAMVTSANLSKQAWGEMENKKGEVWIQSYECGVVVWPDLFAASGPDQGKVVMVPVFGKDLPTIEDVGGEVVPEMGGATKVVGFRMPYNLPLEPYGDEEVPWCATAAHTEPDWKGRAWGGY
ncbi:phospholipase D/nuclease [Pleomassaria siparia CBS 279.74]|uniref:Phospholipase D/nuclease n=1 Tax=Pleomassaria siparia CBS 279.74 TaxID=1314801 RepID=A0A6G1JZT4_9PLEO|nr:phospholipase D/nuclease [Pleomassaria siparia CBS 279.74]